MDPIIKGTGDIIIKPYEVFFDPRRGVSVRYRYTAAGGDAALLSVESVAQLAGWQTRKLVSPVLSELEVTSPDAPEGIAEIITDNWQIVGNEVNESAYYAPPMMSAVSLANRTFIADAIKQGTSTDEAVAALGADANGIQFFKELLKGQDSYAVGQYVLRHTTNCSASSTYNVSDVNVERLYTTAQLLAEVTNGSLWIQPLPTRLVTKIGSIYSVTPPDAEAGFYLWSWRKLPSTETKTVGNRIEINTDYVLYLWSTLRYYLAV